MRYAASLMLLVALACASPAGDVGEISQDELLAGRPAGALVLDVRTRAEYAAGHVPGALNIPHDELGARLAELEGVSDRPVVVYCKSGFRAGIASALLTDAGFTQVYHLTGHMSDWQARGRPIATVDGAGQ